MAKYNIGDQGYYGKDENGDDMLYEKGSVITISDATPPSVTWTALDAAAENALLAIRQFRKELAKWRASKVGERPLLPAMFHPGQPSRTGGPTPVTADTLSEVQKQRGKQ